MCMCSEHGKCLDRQWKRPAGVKWGREGHEVIRSGEQEATRRSPISIILRSSLFLTNVGRMIISF